MGSDQAPRFARCHGQSFVGQLQTLGWILRDNSPWMARGGETTLDLRLRIVGEIPHHNGC